MNVLIVYAHPDPRSFNAALKDLAVETLKAEGHSVRVSDLYAQNFKAVADERDFLSRGSFERFHYQNEQEHAMKTGTIAHDIAAEQEKVLWADLIIFHFPLYWYSLPAILKGWVERVFAYGFAYPGGYQFGRLKGGRAMLVMTTGGTEAAYLPEVKNGAIDMLLFPIQHGILYYTGMEVLPPFIAYAPGVVSAEEREGYKAALVERLQSLALTAPIEFPYPKAPQ